MWSCSWTGLSENFAKVDVDCISLF